MHLQEKLHRGVLRSTFFYVLCYFSTIRSTIFYIFVRFYYFFCHVYNEGVLKLICKRDYYMNTNDKKIEVPKLHKFLDWYIDYASDEEFASNVVISLLHQLDALEPIAPEPIESVEVYIANFWEYCKRHENEERILHSFAVSI